MKTEKIEIQKIEKSYNGEKYIMYLIPEDDEVSCYIQRKNYGIIYHCISVSKEKEKDFSWLIEKNISEWTEIYNEEIGTEWLETSNVDIEE